MATFSAVAGRASPAQPGEHSSHVGTERVRDSITRLLAVAREKALLADCKVSLYSVTVIVSFRSRALKAFWMKGHARKIAPDLVDRLRRRLDALDAARMPEDMDVPGFDLHKLRGKPVRYTVHVNGPWCVTFGWEGENAIAVDFEDYH